MEPNCRQIESNNVEPTDDQLLDQISVAREEAFNQLVERYRLRIYRYAFYLLQSSCEAEDVTQETFIRAFINISKFRREASFLTWLFRIASNVAYQNMGKLVRLRKIKEKIIKNQQVDYNQHINTLWNWYCGMRFSR